MPDELRAELEAAARKRGGGRTLTDEVVARLRVSIAREQEARRNPGTQALRYLISELAERVSFDIDPEWYLDPWTFKAFRAGVTTVMDRLEPKGESDNSELSPEAHGYLQARHLLAEFFHGAHGAAERAEKRLERMESILKGPWVEIDPPPRRGKEFVETWRKVLEANSRRMSRARRDLGFKEPKAPKP